MAPPIPDDSLLHLVQCRNVFFPNVKRVVIYLGHVAPSNVVFTSDGASLSSRQFVLFATTLVCEGIESETRLSLLTWPTTTLSPDRRQPFQACPGDITNKPIITQCNLLQTWRKISIRLLSTSKRRRRPRPWWRRRGRRSTAMCLRTSTTMRSEQTS